MRSLGLTLTQTAWYYSGIAFLGGVAGIWMGGVLADRLGAKSKAGYPLTPAVAFLISVPCFLLAMNSGSLVGGLGGQASLALAFVIFLVPTGLNLAWLGPITAAVQHLAPAPMRTTASALFLLINNLLGLAVGLLFRLCVGLPEAPFGAESLRWAHLYRHGLLPAGQRCCSSWPRAAWTGIGLSRQRRLNAAAHSPDYRHGSVKIGDHLPLEREPPT
jgi:hypothetical protein